MKILFFHRWVGVHSGGTETHLLELAKRFSKLGHEVSILTREGNRLTDIDKKIKVIRIKKNLGESDFSYDDWRVYFHTVLFIIKSLVKLLYLRLLGDKFDVVSVHFVTESIVAQIYRFLFKIPYIFVLEGYTPLEAKFAKKANARISISKFESDVYWSKHRLDSKLIHIGVDLEKYKLDKEKISKFNSKIKNNGEFIVLTVCRLEPRKNLETLIKAAGLVKEKNKKVKFIVVGDGISRQKLENEIRKRNLESTVKLVGFVSNADLPYYYAGADLFLLTSKEEWFGIVFIEAMASGLPIVTTNVDACPEVVGKAGLFFKKKNYRELSRIICMLKKDKVLLRRLSNHSKKRALNFDWNKQIRLYEKVYKDVSFKK